MVRNLLVYDIPGSIKAQFPETVDVPHQHFSWQHQLASVPLIYVWPSATLAIFWNVRVLIQDSMVLNCTMFMGNDVVQHDMLFSKHSIS